MTNQMLLLFAFYIPSTLGHEIFPFCPTGGDTIYAYDECNAVTKSIETHRCEPDIPFDSDEGPSPLFSDIDISGIANVASVSVHINFYTGYVQDLDVWLVHNGVRRKVFGDAVSCSDGGGTPDWVDAVFYDGSSVGPVAGCDTLPPWSQSHAAISGEHKPDETFDVFIGEPMFGIWTLELSDIFGDDWSNSLFGEWTLTLDVDGCPTTYCPQCSSQAPPPPYEQSSCTGGFDFAIDDIADSGNDITASLSDDSYLTVLFPAGFTFEYYGESHASVGIGSNGYLTLPSGSTDWSNDPIPDMSSPNNIIAPLWDDLNPHSGGQVDYALIGTAPNRRFVVQWTDLPEWGVQAGSNTFQAVLFEGSNSIELRYENVEASAYTAGIENQDGTDGIHILSVGNGECYLFELSDCGDIDSDGIPNVCDLCRDCITECTGLSAGNYPLCGECNKFATCVSPLHPLYEMDCPLSWDGTYLVWDDINGICNYATDCPGVCSQDPDESAPAPGAQNDKSDSVNVHTMQDSASSSRLFGNIGSILIGCAVFVSVILVGLCAYKYKQFSAQKSANEVTVSNLETEVKIECDKPQTITA